LRVLTIKALADQGEVNPGATVTLQPVISDLNGGGRNLNVTVQTCVDPGVGYGVQARCVTPDSTTTSSFSGTTLGANNTYTGEAPTFTVNVPALPLVRPLDQYNGIAYLVIYTISAADGSSVTAFKRIIVTDPSKTAKNKNPAISNVTANGAPLAPSNTYSAAGQDLMPFFSAGAETYQLMNADGSFTTQTENLTTTWFYTDGTMKFQRTFDADMNHWDPTPKGAGRGSALVVVTHDGRGGEDYQVFQFN
jgi:hypothetical protein